MKAVKTEEKIDREIEVLGNMIRLLKECFSIYIQSKQKEEAKRTLKDLEICRKELQKLIEAKEVAIFAPKGEKGDAAV